LQKSIRDQLKKTAPGRKLGAGPEVVSMRQRRKRIVKKYGQPSPAGSPPHRQSGTLSRSIRRGTVGGVVRVGTNDFTAPLHEYGGTIAQRPASSGAGKTKRGHGSNRSKEKGQPRKARSDTIVLKPRPFM